MKPDVKKKGANSPNRASEQAQRGGTADQTAKIPFRAKDRNALLREWYRSGHWWKPSDEELILFLENEI